VASLLVFVQNFGFRKAVANLRVGWNEKYIIAKFEGFS
jgi:hypothetical protein